MYTLNQLPIKYMYTLHRLPILYMYTLNRLLTSSVDQPRLALGVGQ